jgi:hypothetical protein
VSDRFARLFEQNDQNIERATANLDWNAILLKPSRRREQAKGVKRNDL